MFVRHFIIGWLLSLTVLGCAKQSPPILSAAQSEVARNHFDRHLNAIGATSTNGIPHSALKMNGVMEIMGQDGRHTFSMEQQSPNLYYIRISIAGVGVFERGYDGEQFWERTPRSSRLLNEEERQSMEPTIDF
jgi:hypothetical protein